MSPRHRITAAALTLAVSGACGLSDGSGPVTSAAEIDPTEPTDAPDETKATEPATVPPSEVGLEIEGTAVATSAGGEEACEAKPEGLLPEGLVEGAPVTILDASSDEVIGIGEVTSTDFVPDQATEVVPPPWTCTFFITATVSSTPDSFRVQVDGLTPLPASFDPDGGFTVAVPSGGDGLPPDTTTSTEPSSSTTAFDIGSTSSTVAP